MFLFALAASEYLDKQTLHGACQRLLRRFRDYFDLFL